MYAIVNTGGKQYKIQQGDVLRVEKIPGEVGSPVSFDKVLCFQTVKMSISDVRFSIMWRSRAISWTRVRAKRLSFSSTNGEKDIAASWDIVSSTLKSRLIVLKLKIKGFI